MCTGSLRQKRGGQKRKAECNVMTCDYNGWNDAPEDEREWFDQHQEIWGGPVREMDRRPYRGTWLGRREERRAS
jgi:hypothetical protein